MCLRGFTTRLILYVDDNIPRYYPGKYESVVSRSSVVGALSPVTISQRPVTTTDEGRRTKDGDSLLTDYVSTPPTYLLCVKS